MLSAHKIQKHIGARAILDGVSLSIAAGERVGLVGRNGCGKTTLLRILTGEEAPDTGAVGAIRRGLSVGYLPQIPEIPRGRTVLEEAMAELPLGVAGWQAKRHLLALGFAPAALCQEAQTLSGGEKTRLMLARLLLGDHDLLLLDEPTSHLDIGMLRWLERMVVEHRGACLIVSHDRRFLDRTVCRIVELDEGRLTEYAGNYTAYVAQKQARIERDRTLYVEQQRQINALREFAARQMGWAAKCQAGPKAGRDVRGRIAEKIAKRAHAAERRVEQIEADAVEKAHDAAGVSAAFRGVRRSGQTVFETRDLGMRFGDRALFDGVDLTVAFGERVGIVGANGAGKTTLLRLLLGEAEPTEGTIRRGAGVVPFHAAQIQEQFDPDATVLATLEEVGRMTPTEARTLLACFLFRDTEVFKLVRMLSGGERVRLAVAAAVASDANLLVLDEPTNYLDTDTRERLEQALEGYKGTLLVVSHDRYLLDRLTHRTIALEAGRLTDYPGPYAEWEERQPAT